LEDWESRQSVPPEEQEIQLSGVDTVFPAVFHQIAQPLQRTAK
jgi:hypothetical protein